MILYTNGCSFTWGGGLDHLFRGPEFEVNDETRLPVLWPHHLGRLLNASETYNLSVGCGSNQRILRTTYDWLISQPKHVLEQTVAVIQLTEWSRFEMFLPKYPEDIWENHPGDWLNCKVDVVVNDTAYMYSRGKSADELQQAHKEALRRIATTTEVDDFYKSISYLYALKGLFLSFGIKDFYFWQQSHDWVYWPKNHMRSVYDNFKVLDEVENLEDRIIFQDTIWKYETVSNTDRHPSIEGHKQLANIIYTQMNRKGFQR